MTPRTDREIWWVGFKPDEKLEAVWADFARDLERENAELRKAKDMVELERCEMMRSMSLAQNYSEQLRADKERLDWLISKAPFNFFKELGPDLVKGRKQIDAARKEAQP